LTLPKSRARRILGLDPGLASVGYGCVEIRGNTARHISHGVIRTEAGQDLASRLVCISRGLAALLLELRPDEAAVEELFFGRNVTTGMAVSHARGVLLLTLAEHTIPISEYPPGLVKSTVSGDGRADKEAMQRMVRIRLGLQELPRPDDAADGLAIALCHAQHIPALAALLENKKETRKKSGNRTPS